MIRSDQLAALNPELITVLADGPPLEARRASAVESCGPGDLAFASKKEQLAVALERRPSILVIAKELSLPGAAPEQTRVFKAANVGLAMSLLLPRFDTKDERFETGIHPSAVVHPTAQLGRNARIGPGAVIGPRVRLGDDVRVGAQTVIETGADIGARTTLHPLVFIGAHCRLGADCEVHPHTTIGSDGFSFAQDQSGASHKIPQLGIVVIGDRVEIGANCAFDRAAFGETRIGAGTKFDNLCHVAHNVRIGENCVFAGGFFVAGSSVIGDRFMCGGTVAIADHITVADGVVMAGRSATAQDIPAPGAYGGYPPQPLRESMKTLSSLPLLPQLRKDVTRILKHLGLEEKK